MGFRIRSTESTQSESTQPKSNTAHEAKSHRLYAGNLEHEGVKPRLFSRFLHEKTFEYSNSDNVLETLIKLKESDIHAQAFTLDFKTQTGESQSIQIIYAEPENRDEKTKVDVFAHGRRGHIGSQLASAIESYKNGGKAFCLTSYRGVDGNPGIASQQTNADAIDRAVEFLLHEQNFKSKNINFIGSSMGSESIVNMLYRRRHVLGSVPEKFGKVKLIAPYLSLKDIALHGIAHYSLLRGKETTLVKPSLWIFSKTLTPSKIFNYLFNPLFSLKDHLWILPSSASSVEIYASKADKLVPFSQSKRIYEITKNEFSKSNLDPEKHVRFYEFEHLNHSEIAAKIINETRFPKDL